MLIQVAKQQSSNLFVLGTLAGLALWGHATDWTFSFASQVQQFAKHGKMQAASAAAANAAHTADQPTAASNSPGEQQIAIPAQDERELQRQGIQVGRPEQRPMHEEVTAHGHVTYMQTRTANLSARVPGTVWSVHCEVGDTVGEDEVLAILDAADVGQAKAAFLQAVVAAEVAVATLERLKSIGDAVPENRIREVDALARQAVVERFNAQQALINLGLPIQYDELAGLTDEQRARRVQFLGLPERVTRGLDPRTTTANLLPIVAPFDGVVIRREMVVGEIVSPNQAELAVADVSRMWIRLNISKEDALRVEVGQPVSFTAGGLHKPVESTISWISTEADAKTRTVEALAVVNNPVVDDDDAQGQRLLKANTFGIAKIRVSEQPTALVVPDKAVHFTGHEHVVFVAHPQLDDPDTEERRWIFELRTVHVGARQAGQIEITRGLALGDTIVVDGGQMLRSEMQRKVARSEGKSDK